MRALPYLKSVFLNDDTKRYIDLPANISIDAGKPNLPERHADEG
jgi:hypothetical protein